MKKRALILLTVICILFNLPMVIEQDTSASTTCYGSEIATAVEWNQSGSPYYIEGHITITPTGVLTITPGVEVRFNGSFGLFVDGMLYASGTNSQPITFKSNRSTPVPGDWIGIQFNSTGDGRMAFTQIQHAQVGLTVEQTDPTLKHIIISNPSTLGASFKSCSTTLYNSSLGTISLDSSGGPETNVTSVNSTFSIGSIDQNSVLQVENYLDILVRERETLDPLPNTHIRVRDGTDVLYATSYWGGNDPRTGSDGHIPNPVMVTDRWYIHGATATENNTQADAYRSASLQVSNSSVDMSSSHTLILEIDMTPPSMPTGLMVVDIGGTWFTLMWDPNPEPDIEGYIVFVSESEALPWSDQYSITSQTSINVTERLELTKYYIAIVARDLDFNNNSPRTDPISVVTLDATPPTAPTNLTIVEVTGHEITLEWSKSPQQDVAGYRMFMNDTGQGIAGTFRQIDDIMPNFSIYTAYGLRDETMYYFKILSYDNATKPNISPFSSVVNASTSDITPPGLPTVEPLPEFTMEPSIRIYGRAEPNSTVIVLKGSEVHASGIASPSAGIFSIPVTLDEGINFFSVQARDTSNNMGPVTEPQQVILDTLPPVARAGVDRDLNVGTTVHLSGINSTDEWGISSYTWTIYSSGDIRYFFNATVNFTFDDIWDYKIELNVSDPAGNWDLDEMWVNVTLWDTSPPFVISTSPKDGSVDIPVDIDIYINLSEKVNFEKASFTMSSASKKISGSLGPGVSSSQLRFSPLGNLSYNYTFGCRLTVPDLLGNTLENYSFSFSTSTAPPDTDSDSDGWDDRWEMEVFGDLDQGPDDDADADGISNQEEIDRGMDPMNMDQDTDGIRDGWELEHGLDPMNPDDGEQDTDGDGFSNLEEYDFDTDPNDPRDYPVSDGSDDSSSLWIIVLVIVVIVVVLLMFLFIVLPMMGKGLGSQKGDREKSPTGVEKGPSTSPLLTPKRPEGQRSISLRPQEDTTRQDIGSIECPSCGASLEPGAAYCYECGTDLD